MVVGRQENFLRRLEVDFLSLKVVFCYHGDLEIWFRKVKNPKKFTFPEILRIGVSYGSDFFSNVNI